MAEIKDGDIIQIGPSERIAKTVTKDQFKLLAEEAGWDRKTIELFLRDERVYGKPVVVKEYVPVGAYALKLRNP